MKLVLVTLALAAAPAVAFAPHTDPDLVEPTVAPTKYPTVAPTQTCYEFTLSSTTVTWGECATECEALDGFFPCILDASQNAEAYAALVSSGINSAWINLHDTASEGFWVCSTSLQVLTYLPWDPNYGEPNGGTNENCANMWGPSPGLSRTPGTWNDAPCGFDNPGVRCLCKTPTPCDA